MVWLKRLNDAVKDGDPIVAVIHGSATNSDGMSTSLTAPNPEAQEELLRKALNNAHIIPKQIGFLETHGTGTRLGDPIEVGAIANVYGASKTEGAAPLYLGAVKSNLGHLEAAAGMAGLIKTALALKHG